MKLTKPKTKTPTEQTDNVEHTVSSTQEPKEIEPRKVQVHERNRSWHLAEQRIIEELPQEQVLELEHLRQLVKEQQKEIEQLKQQLKKQQEQYQELLKQLS